MKAEAEGGGGAGRREEGGRREGEGRGRGPVDRSTWSHHLTSEAYHVFTHHASRIHVSRIVLARPRLLYLARLLVVWLGQSNLGGGRMESSRQFYISQLTEASQVGLDGDPAVAPEKIR